MATSDRLREASTDRKPRALEPPRWPGRDDSHPWWPRDRTATLPQDPPPVRPLPGRIRAPPLEAGPAADPPSRQGRGEYLLVGGPSGARRAFTGSGRSWASRSRRRRCPGTWCAIGGRHRRLGAPFSGIDPSQQSLSCVDRRLVRHRNLLERGRIVSSQNRRPVAAKDGVLRSSLPIPVDQPQPVRGVPRAFLGTSVHAKVAGCCRYWSRRARSRASVRSRLERPIP